MQPLPYCDQRRACNCGLRQIIHILRRNVQENALSPLDYVVSIFRPRLIGVYFLYPITPAMGYNGRSKTGSKLQFKVKAHTSEMLMKYKLTCSLMRNVFNEDYCHVSRDINARHGEKSFHCAIRRVLTGWCMSWLEGLRHSKCDVISALRDWTPNGRPIIAGDWVIHGRDREKHRARKTWVEDTRYRF